MPGQKLFFGLPQKIKGPTDPFQKIKKFKKKLRNLKNFYYSTPSPRFACIAEGVCKTSVLLV